ncbi:MAG: NAD(P)H-hydrate dehydratase [Clostridia bacterium]|nr:NAD(P)H-hydrate dehydratase [Clostridia bacterium]
MLTKSFRILRLTYPRETFETLRRLPMRRGCLRQLPRDRGRYNPNAEAEQAIPLITPAQMRAMEQRYFDETGTPSIDLMERAAEALLRCIQLSLRGKWRVSIACGPGGNGGDGYALARLLAQRLGWDCALYPSEPPKTPDAIENRRRALEMGIPERSPREGEAPDLWVDALYGTGLSRAPEGAAAALIERMNADRQEGASTIAVDIPSGLNGTTGKAFSPCVRADQTITFQFAKTGLCMQDGLDMCGMLDVADIGIPAEFHPAITATLMTTKDPLSVLPSKPRNAHKGTNGRLLIVAGSVGMAGAAMLCARAALRSGAGLVTVACPASIVPILQVLAPCAMCLPLPERDGAISAEAVEPLAAALRSADAAVCGCGLSRRAAPEVLRLMLECGVPTLFDADGLNLIAADASLKALLRPHHLITPHPGEAARLLGRPVTDPIADALALQALGCQALLKGATTVIPVGDVPWLSARGDCGMAKGGSGDCLSGLAGSLMAQYAAAGTAMTGEALARCAAVASELHGRAGEFAQVQFGPRGMCAEDLVNALPRALQGDE